MRALPEPAVAKLAAHVPDRIEAPVETAGNFPASRLCRYLDRRIVESGNAGRAVTQKGRAALEPPDESGLKAGLRARQQCRVRRASALVCAGEAIASAHADTPASKDTLNRCRHHAVRVHNDNIEMQRLPHAPKPP